MYKIKLLQRTFLSLVLLIVLLNTNAQTGLNFQGVARNSNNVILASQAITIKLSILQGSATGAADYVETRRVNTNAQGLFTVVIGDTGAISTLGNFATINWKTTPKFLKIEMDPLAGSNFITMGTTQFQYVAYAQFANSVDAENIVGIVPVARGGTGTNSLSNLKTALALDKVSVGLQNVDNTSDALKPISAAVQTALDLKANTDTATFSKDITVNGISIGKGAGSKVSNTRIGYEALSNITTGTDNSALGKGALSNVTIGSGNTAMGVNGLRNNTIGNYNTAIGLNTLMYNTTGNYNTAFGVDALHDNTTGYYNTALGPGALYTNKIGNNNTAIGNASLSLNTGNKNSAFGDASMQLNTTGSGNTAIGNEALLSNTTGSNNTVLGYKANVGANDLTNATAIGNGALVSASNTIQLGNTSVTNVKTAGIITASGFGTLSGTSAQFLKADGSVDGNNYVNSADTKIKIGEAAGGDNQGLNAIGIGLYAGSTNQGDLSVAIGSQAGYINQGTNAVAIGITSGSLSQAYNAIAIGNKAGNDLQGVSAIAIGRNAGKSSQGSNAIAIGQFAGETNQAANSIILNASAASLNATTNGFYVAPIRSANTPDNLYYNATTKEITYAPVSAVDAGTLTGTSLASNVVNSSLTSVGTLANVTTTGKAIVGASTAATASAVMEVNSTTQGFLPPRMTQAQRDAIVSPATGLMIFCTNCSPKGDPEFYNGTRWTSMNAAPLANTTIGDQVWSSTNLNVSRYRNGDVIPQVTDPTAWSNLTTGAWCWYNNDSVTYAATYGKLYNWYAVNDPRGLAPLGWHIPTEAEWITLTDYLGGTSVAGGFMKQTGTTNWIPPNTSATNTSGFTGLPGAHRYYDGTFNNVGYFGFWWSASGIDTTNAEFRFLHYGTALVGRNADNKSAGYSVRCVRD